MPDSRIFAVGNSIFIISNRCNASIFPRSVCQTIIFKYSPICTALLIDIHLNDFVNNKEFINAFKINFELIAIFNKTPLDIDPTKYSINLMIYDMFASSVLNEGVFLNHVFIPL